MKIPAGDHTLEFVFEPKTYRIGTLLTKIFSSLILIGSFGYAGYSGWQYFKNLPEEIPNSPQSTAVPAKVAIADSRKKKKK